jgi:hypothetical protein
MRFETVPAPEALLFRSGDQPTGRSCRGGEWQYKISRRPGSALRVTCLADPELSQSGRAVTPTMNQHVERRSSTRCAPGWTGASNGLGSWRISGNAATEIGLPSYKRIVSPDEVGRTTLCCTDQQPGAVSPRSDIYGRRTYSGRPSSSMRFSVAMAMATSGHLPAFGP